MSLQFLMPGVLTGVIATVGMDVWAMIVKHVFHLPTANWAMVGRWIGHMPRGVFRHRHVGDSDPVPRELAVGWVTHYVVGGIYGLLYLGVVHALLSGRPSLRSALVFGLVTLAAPWFVMQPCMGAGVFASQAPRPNQTRLINLSMHLVFGLSLFGAWQLFR